MKAGKEHLVPLSDAAMTIVEKMAAIRSGDFVFPGGKAERPLLYRGQCQARPDDRMLSPFCALANDATRGSRFSSRLAGRHLMMG